MGGVNSASTFVTSQSLTRILGGPRWPDRTRLAKNEAGTGPVCTSLGLYHTAQESGNLTTQDRCIFPALLTPICSLSKYAYEMPLEPISDQCGKEPCHRGGEGGGKANSVQEMHKVGRECVLQHAGSW